MFARLNGHASTCSRCATLVRSHEAGLAFAGAPSRPVVINQSPPLARIVKWAALLAAATELPGT